MGSREFVLAHLVSDWFSADGRLAPQPTWKRQHDSHQMPVHQRHAHGLHGLLQLLRLGGGAPDHHDRTVRRDLPRHLPPAQPPGRGHLWLEQVLPQRAETCKVVIASSVSVRALLATTTYYELYCVLLPDMQYAQECCLRGYLYVTHQLCAQSTGVRFPYPALPRYADSYHPAICAL